MGGTIYSVRPSVIGKREGYFPKTRMGKQNRAPQQKFETKCDTIRTKIRIIKNLNVEIAYDLKNLTEED